VTAVRLTKRDRSHPALRRWLHLHGLDPRRVAVLPGTEPEVRDGRVHAVLWRLDGKGRKVVDTEWTGDAWRRPVVVDLVSVPLVAPLPDGIGEPVR
jgi:hypothetical protein